ncbi:MAG: methyl-accepting chemotaxis protein [Oscillospiraceae bacterium]|nr:methyl-accepting chemotaxis protein [Oscillospiraceae bacterium]
MKASKKIGRKTTIAARIVRLCTILGSIAILAVTGVYQYIMFIREKKSVETELNTLTYAFSSAISNADIYNNKILENLFVEFDADNEYEAKGFAISQLGAVVSETDGKIFTKGENAVDKGAEDPAYNDFALLVDELDTQFKDIDIVLNGMAERTGVREMTVGGVRYFVGWAPIRRYDTLRVYVFLPYENVMAPLRRMFILCPVISAVYLVISFFIARLVAKRISKPLVDASARMGTLARGDLTSPYPRTSMNDETLYLLKSLSLVVKANNTYISDITRTLNAIADGDLSVTPQADYQGDYAELKTALERIIQSLNDTFAEVHKAALSVNDCSVHVSEGTAALSRNAADESDAVSRITESVSDVNTRIILNAKQAERAFEMTESANRSAAGGSESMAQMVNAIEEIEKTSAQIERIIAVIDDIAFQTNILALNAAVEAARAGDAGKGFAVVADEVRTLAVKSGEAAAHTKELIENSLEAVRKGTALAAQTNTSLENVAEMVNSTMRITREISQSANEQARKISSINDNMEHISETVNENSRTAEQNAAVSQELSGQFEVLSRMINRFKLK